MRAVLASDAEREATSRVVAHAIGEGRLSLDEGRQRIDAAYGARHRHELAELVGDLPSVIQSSDRSSLAAPRRSGCSPPRRRWPSWRRSSRWSPGCGNCGRLPFSRSARSPGALDVDLSWCAAQRRADVC